MKLVILTAIGVGMSTVIGSVIGFAIKRISHKFNDVVLGFAAGVMLAVTWGNEFIAWYLNFIGLNV